MVDELPALWPSGEARDVGNARTKARTRRRAGVPEHRPVAPDLWPRAGGSARLHAFDQVLLRVDEPETAAFIARQIGECETLREEIGISTAEHGNRDTSIPTRRTEPVVMASEIQRLPKLEGIYALRDSIVPASR